MFTGLIERTGELRERRMTGAAGKLSVNPSSPFDGLKRGDSVAVNGACLTVEGVASDGTVSFHVLEETFRRTNLGSLPVGGILNLERALALGDRLGGHLVSGHIDSAAKIVSISKAGSDTELRVESPSSLEPYLVEKGSVAIDGISLTVASVSDSSFTVRIIPVTWEKTALSSRRQGELVNLESDLIGKYVLKQLGWLKGGSEAPAKRGLDMDTLIKAGF